MTYPKAMPIVEVEWLDSAAKGRWSTPEQYREAIGESPLVCRSAGYLFIKNRVRVGLVQSQNATGDVMDLIDIPRSVVRSIRVLAPAAKKKEVKL